MYTCVLDSERARLHPAAISGWCLLNGAELLVAPTHVSGRLSPRFGLQPAVSTRFLYWVDVVPLG